MKKILLSAVFFLFFAIISIVGYLVIFGYETNKFNSLLENKIKSSLSNVTVNIEKIKVKINIKNLNFFITTSEPRIKYRGNAISIKRVDAYIKLNSFLSGKPNIDKVNITSNEINIDKTKDIVKYFKPSNFKKFFLNDIEKGKLLFNIDLFLKNNEIINFEINGYVKNLFASVEDINLKDSSFIYLIGKDSGEINNIRGFLNGFQINSGYIKFDNSKLLNINGNLKSDVVLNQLHLNNILKKKNTTEF